MIELPQTPIAEKIQEKELSLIHPYRDSERVLSVPHRQKAPWTLPKRVLECLLKRQLQRYARK